MRFASKERTRFSTPTCGEERKDIWPPLLTIIDLKKKDAIGGLIKWKKNNPGESIPCSQRCFEYAAYLPDKSAIYDISLMLSCN